MCPTNHQERPRLFRNLKPLVLASQSPRRRELLKALGLTFEVIPPEVEEPAPSGEPPEEYVKKLASLKARAVAEGVGSRAVLAADTVVVLGDRIIGKPGDRDEACKMLSSLSGRAHQVFTGYALVDEGRELVRVVRSEVVFKELLPEEIEAYVATGEPMDKAGAYAVQGMGSYMVREIHGSVTNVIGLPLTEVVEDLLKLRIIDWEISTHKTKLAQHQNAGFWCFVYREDK